MYGQYGRVDRWWSSVYLRCDEFGRRKTRSADTWCGKPRDVRLWNKLKHLLWQDNVSVFEAVIRVGRSQPIIPLGPISVLVLLTSIRVDDPARSARGIRGKQRTHLSDNSSNVFPPLGAISTECCLMLVIYWEW